MHQQHRDYTLREIERFAICRATKPAQYRPDKLLISRTLVIECQGHGTGIEPGLAKPLHLKKEGLERLTTSTPGESNIP